MEWVCIQFCKANGVQLDTQQSISNLFCFVFKDNQGGYGSVGRMGMGNNYSGGYGTPDGLGGYGKCLCFTLVQFVSPHMQCRLSSTLITSY